MDSTATVKVSGAKGGATDAHKVMVGGLVLCLGALLFAFRETLTSLFNLWMDSYEYGHGLLVVPLVIYLLWLRRHALAVVPVRPSWFGLLMCTGLIVLWALSDVLGILIAEQLALVLLLLSIPWAVSGWRLMRECALPVLLLLLAVPIWSYINPILQANTATASTAMIRLVGVPVFNEGVYLTIPGGRFLVAEVCSGLRYLLASMTLAALFSILNLRSAWNRLLLVVVSFFLSMVFNWIRVSIIVSAGHYLGMETSLVRHHIWLGWVVFGIVAVLILWIGNVLQNHESKSPVSPAKVAWPGIDTDRRRLLLSGAYAIICSVLLLSAGGLIGAEKQAVTAMPLTLDLRAVKVPGYSSVAANDNTGWRAAFQNSDAESQVVFQGSGLPISVYVGYYRWQRQGAEVVNDRNTLFDVDNWIRTAIKPKPEVTKITPKFKAEEFQIRRIQGTEQLLIWRLYWVDGEYAGTGVDAKLRQITALLHGNRAAAGLVFSVPVRSGVARSRQQLRAFVETALAPVGNYLSSLGYR